jgi:hypothetical protein
MGRTAADILAEHGVELSEDELAHYGKLGMKWGRRKKQSSSGDSSEPSKPNVKAMSDDELKSAINRLKLEKEYSTLTAREVHAGKKIVGNLLLNVGQQLAKEFITAQANKQIYGHPGGLKAALAVAEAAAKEAASNPAKAANSARPLMKLVGQK